MEFSITNPFQAMATIVYRPGPTLAHLKDTRGWSWLPALLLLALVLGLQWLYFHRVDFDWFQATYLAPEMTDLARADRERVMAALSPERLQTMGLITALLSILLLHALMGFYLSRMTLSDENNLLGFGDWFGLTWWASVPSILVALASLAWLLGQNGEIAQGMLNLAAVNRGLGLASDHNWYGFAESLSWLLPWQIGLYAIGIQRWTALTLKQGIWIAALPFGCIYLGWAAWNLFS